MTRSHSSPMINLYALTFKELSALLTELGEEPYRARQIWDWMFERRVDRFDAMTNLPKATIARLREKATLGSLELVARQQSHRRHGKAIAPSRRWPADRIRTHALRR